MSSNIGTLFSDDTFAALFPTRGRPALAPWRLALVTILQFAEGLSDRQAADAVRSRIDWKYLLRLPLTDAGFDASVLVEFRARLVAGQAEEQLLDTLLAWCRERQLLTARGRQRTDSTLVLAAVRALNRVELVGETVRHALDVLAVAAPAWLAAVTQPDWADRYTRRVDEYRLPKGQGERLMLAETIGADGQALLRAAHAEDAPRWLRELPVLETLRHVWVQQYVVVDGVLRWRTADEGLPAPAIFMSSPHDLLPGTHIVDTGFLDAQLLVASRQVYDVDLLGPTRLDYHWQARERNGFAAEHFRIDWDRCEATCPEGHTSTSWTPSTDRSGDRVIRVKFSPKVCRDCPSRTACTRATKPPRRTITIQDDAAFHALHAARARTRAPDYDAEYRRRAGIEGTLSRGVRRCGLRKARYLGLAKTRLQHLLIAAALNFIRVGEWLADLPRPKSRRTAFARFIAAS